jgi:DNA (cytosine-5)-methyltransferase 1
MLTFGSLFSGIGGFDLGFERAGLKNVWQVEIDRDCNRVLDRHWPERTSFKDVREFRCSSAKGIVRPDAIVGGFPCQDLSVAGDRAGLAGDRSGLFFQFARVIDEFAPRWVCIENVPGLLSSHGGRDMGTVIGCLEKLGFGWAYRVLDAQYFGLAQQRARLFIVGCFGDCRRAAGVLFEAESVSFDSRPSRGEREDNSTATSGMSEAGKPIPLDMRQCSRGATMTNNRPGGSSGGAPGTGIGQPGDPAPTLAASHVPAIYFDPNSITSPGNFSAPKFGNLASTLAASASKSVPAIAFQTRIGRNGRGQPKPITDALTSCAAGTHADSKPHVAYGAIVRRLMPLECERIQGFPDNWTVVDSYSDGLHMSKSARYRMLGNAVPPQQTEWIGKNIIRLDGVKR